MKIQLDTTNKTIKVEESVSLKELTEALEKLLPNNEWKEFKLETNTVIHNWSQPIIIRERGYYPWLNPYSNPRVIFKSGTASVNSSRRVNDGVYNIEA